MLGTAARRFRCPPLRSFNGLQLAVPDHREERQMSTGPVGEPLNALVPAAKATSVLSTSAKAALVGPSMAMFLKTAPVISCQALWAAPYPTVQQVIKDKSTGGLPPLGYFSMFANGYLWMCYGISAGMDMTMCVIRFLPSII